MREVTEIGRRLTVARLAARLPMRDLGRRAGTTQSLIHQIETGLVMNPGVFTIQRLAKQLKVNPTWLAWGIGKADGKYDAPKNS